MSKAGGNEEIPLTTRELIAAILIFSPEDIFLEKEIVDQVEKMRSSIPGHHAFSPSRVDHHLQWFLTSQILRYAGASDTFFIDQRNKAYLKDVLTEARVFPDMEMGLRELVQRTETPLGAKQTAHPEEMRI